MNTAKTPLELTYNINDMFGTPKVQKFSAAEHSNAIVGQMRGVASEFAELRAAVTNDPDSSVFEKIVDSLGDALVFCDGIPYRLGLSLDQIRDYEAPIFPSLDDNNCITVNMSSSVGLPVIQSLDKALSDMRREDADLDSEDISTTAYYASIYDFMCLEEIPRYDAAIFVLFLASWRRTRILIKNMLGAFGVSHVDVIRAIHASQESKLCSSLEVAQASIDRYVSKGMPADALAIEGAQAPYIIRVTRSFEYLDGNNVLQDVFEGKFLKSIDFQEPDYSFLRAGGNHA